MSVGKVLGERAKWSTGAEAGTQRHFLTRLFRDSECTPAAGHQQLIEWDRTQSVVVSHCHFQRVWHETTACSFQEVDKAVIVSQMSFYWPPGLYWPLSYRKVHHHQSVQWVTLRALTLQVCRYDLYFAFYSNLIVSTVMLLSWEVCFKHRLK